MLSIINTGGYMKCFNKKVVLLFFLGFLSITSADAKFLGPETKNEMNIREIMSSYYDDMKVVVKGYLFKRLSHDKYMFKDGTGEIIVDIDEKYMPDQDITPKTLIKIYGEIDIKSRYGHKVEIDAHKIEIIK